MSKIDYENEIKDWTKLLAGNAGEDDAFVNEFIDLINGSEKIREEYIYYMINNRFLGEYSVCGMTVVDIMIWQMDHFKSDLDRGLYDMQSNPNKMLIRAFYTMLKMEKDPQLYIEKYGSDTGTDYPGKF
ncbi:MAG: hypothetical protein K5921_10365 [Lachnospiraceae bacterium]|nr:hypothetical protein [Lachnospiraceae bacterium]